mmetsp:Transcript_86050/g.221572  ORF Transcript_86050/g.221572 Transcript_86050/m.221572 type:complete len:207 (+) Transcript_86050:152-772(+)
MLARAAGELHGGRWRQRSQARRGAEQVRAQPQRGADAQRQLRPSGAEGEVQRGHPAARVRAGGRGAATFGHHVGVVVRDAGRAALRPVHADAAVPRAGGRRWRAGLQRALRPADAGGQEHGRAPGHPDLRAGGDAATPGARHREADRQGGRAQVPALLPDARAAVPAAAASQGRLHHLAQRLRHVPRHLPPAGAERLRADEFRPRH